MAQNLSNSLLSDSVKVELVKRLNKVCETSFVTGTTVMDFRMCVQVVLGTYPIDVRKYRDMLFSPRRRYFGAMRKADPELLKILNSLLAGDEEKSEQGEEDATEKDRM